MNRKDNTMMLSSEFEQSYRAATPRPEPCLLDQCPLHETCLHWWCKRFVDTTHTQITTVNPLHPLTGTAQCPLYLSSERVVLKRGLFDFFDQMTSRQEHAIRSSLMQLFNRKNYYRVRNGEMPIPPAMRQQIEDTCRQHGYTGPFVYDSEEEGWAW